MSHEEQMEILMEETQEWDAISHEEKDQDQVVVSSSSCNVLFCPVCLSVCLSVVGFE